jgi:hypothetical protein
VGEPFWPGEERVGEIRERGRAAVDYIAAQGFHVVGDLDSLLVPERLPVRRVPESVTDSEVAQVAVELAARMLHDVRDLRHERRDLRTALARAQEHEDQGLRIALSRRFPVLRHVLLRGSHRPEPT